MSTKWQIITILTLSLIVHFAFFGYPNETVFDEVHFGKFVSGYYTGQYYFDIHPPLGKLMIAGFAKLFNFKPEFSFAEIGQKFPDKLYLALRFLPSLAGSLLPVLIYLLALELGLSQKAAFSGGLLVALENALLVQSRYILMDAFLLLFGFATLLFYLKYRSGDKSTIRWGILMAVFGGLAASIKWTGLTFIAIPCIIEAAKAASDLDFRRLLKMASFVGLSFLVYFSFFVVHLSLLSKSGSGDAFMSPGFQKTLQGNPNQKNVELKTPPLFKKFTELNIEMYRANKGLTATHPYSSRWYTWPLMQRPIYYWVRDNARIYLLGNPVIWWASTVAIFCLIIFLILELLGLNAKYLTLNSVSWILLGGWLINLLPFIGIKRAMFLYHYLTGLVFAILALAYLIDKTSKNPKKSFVGLIICASLAFVYFAPLSYGLKLTDKGYNARAWLQNWR